MASTKHKHHYSAKPLSIALFRCILSPWEGVDKRYRADSASTPARDFVYRPSGRERRPERKRPRRYCRGGLAEALFAADRREKLRRDDQLTHAVRPGLLGRVTALGPGVQRVDVHPGAVRAHAPRHLSRRAGLLRVARASGGEITIRYRSLTPAQAADSPRLVAT